MKTLKIVQTFNTLSEAVSASNLRMHKPTAEKQNTNESESTMSKKKTPPKTDTETKTPTATKSPKASPAPKAKKAPKATEAKSKTPKQAPEVVSYAGRSEYTRKLKDQGFSRPEAWEKVKAKYRGSSIGRVKAVFDKKEKVKVAKKAPTAKTAKAPKTSKPEAKKKSPPALKKSITPKKTKTPPPIVAPKTETEATETRAEQIQQAEEGTVIAA